MNNQNLELICDELRRRICTGEVPGGGVIHENTLGKEFGLSRTPIRQVLHKLAMQHFIETKTGVGSVVIENDRFDLKEDLRVCQGLLSLSNRSTDIPLKTDDHVKLSGMLVLQKALYQAPSHALYWDATYELNKLIASHLSHDLISENYKLLTYRIYRQVISLNKCNIDKLVESFDEEISLANKCNTSNELIKAKSMSTSHLKNII
jgi:DNA-binding GntR family transcriptional regulator